MSKKKRIKRKKSKFTPENVKAWGDAVHAWRWPLGLVLLFMFLTILFFCNERLLFLLVEYVADKVMSP